MSCHVWWLGSCISGYFFLIFFLKRHSVAADTCSGTPLSLRHPGIKVLSIHQVGIRVVEREMTGRSVFTFSVLQERIRSRTLTSANRVTFQPVNTGYRSETGRKSCWSEKQHSVWGHVQYTHKWLSVIRAHPDCFTAADNWLYDILSYLTHCYCWGNNQSIYQNLSGILFFLELDPPPQTMAAVMHGLK